MILILVTLRRYHGILYYYYVTGRAICKRYDFWRNSNVCRRVTVVVVVTTLRLNYYYIMINGRIAVLYYMQLLLLLLLYGSAVSTKPSKEQPITVPVGPRTV